MSDQPLASTLGALRASGYPDRTVKQEIAANATARLRAGEPLVDGLVGFDQTVLPALETALLAGHDLILLGERGQAKSRIIRSLVTLLDEAVPIVAGSEVNDHPFHPFTPAARRLVDERGDDTPIEWIGRDQRYAEKLATPDIAVADLVGDVDPIKVAEGRYLGDDETIHFGLIPRHNRGIIALNELPDLAERIQVALLNVMEERDVQVRGYSLRLPLDLMVVTTANPEDYTNRGRIITPLKDRFGSEIRTHYPLSIDHEVDVMVAEAVLPDSPPIPAVVVPTFMAEVLAAFTRSLRMAAEVNQRSGVSVRFSTGNYETLAASAVRRAVRTGEESAVARPSDLPAVIAASMGKIEFESFEEGREVEIMTRLMKRSILEVFRRRVRGADVAGLLDAFETGLEVTTGDLVSGRELMGQMDRIPGLAAVLAGLDVEESPAMAAAAVELCLEGLHLSRRLDRHESDIGYTYVQG
ncbi:sigma 54-interacting transcriptional regulator [Euzebya tangerina]|uniref:sigma 54-interacting transcriptional regulator n=1 Tax=Euzebya tangerina TaxID=591198 RepID=UPI000E322C02|nr:sigma 54-interacting transcriptional regulator [Euzebya tangerina]